MTLTHAEYRLHMLILLAKLEVGYSYTSYSIASVMSGAAGLDLPAGSLRLPIASVYCHWLVPKSATH
jgi:hypothetical protein